jgi:hypothetical protein
MLLLLLQVTPFMLPQKLTNFLLLLNSALLMLMLLLKMILMLLPFAKPAAAETALPRAASPPSPSPTRFNLI